MSENLPYKPVQELIEQADAELAKFGDRPFSEAGFATLKEKMSGYIASLILESSRRAKRHQADVISAADVEKADEYLIASSHRKLTRNIGTIGGIVLGAGVSNVMSIITTNQFTPSGIVTTVLFCVIGTAMIAYQFAKD
jgi:hypothetical protein